MSEKPISPLRRRMIEYMTVRNFVEKTRNDYIRHVRLFTAFLGRLPDTATPEDLRRFQLHQTQTGVRAPSINGSVAALCRQRIGFVKQSVEFFRRDPRCAGDTCHRFERVLRRHTAGWRRGLEETGPPGIVGHCE